MGKKFEFNINREKFASIRPPKSHPHSNRSAMIDGNAILCEFYNDS